jgi:hypothetical protein
MSSWSVTSEYRFSVYGSGLERTHQFDEQSATLEVLVNTGTSTQPASEVVTTTITRPDGCDGTTVPPQAEVEIEVVGVRGPLGPSATVVGEASCLYGGPSWMSSWSVTSEYRFSVYGSGLERTHQFDEQSATLEVLVNTGTSTQPASEVVTTTITRPDGCDGTTPAPQPVVEVDLAAEPKLLISPVPILQAAAGDESTVPREQDDDDRSDRERDKSDREDRRDDRNDRRDDRNDRRDDRNDRRDDRNDRRDDRREDRNDRREDRRHGRRD